MIEAVPNVSEGRHAPTLAALAGAVLATPGAHLLHQTADPDHNRAVFTFAGETEPVLAAALALAGAAFASIDINRHTGVHPRIGALDVLPFVPLRDATLAGCARLAVEAGEEIWSRFRVPVYLYEASARTAERRALENIRRPAFSGKPDIGEGRHPAAGAVVVGARSFLVAWNIWLATPDLDFAKRTARRVRASSGGFPGVKALGLFLAARGRAQVSINTTDFEATPLHHVFQAVECEARAAGIPVLGSELIGLIPERALALSAGHDLRWLNLTPGSVIERRIENLSAGPPGSV